jgi:hypothetical protein
MAVGIADPIKRQAIPIAIMSRKRVDLENDNGRPFERHRFLLV